MMFSEAMAEAAASATEAVSAVASSSTQMRPGTVITLVFDAYFFLTGIASLITGKVYGAYGRVAGSYTDESLGKFARPYGVGQIMIGGGALLAFLPVTLGYMSIPLVIAGFVIGIAGCVGLLVAHKKILVKR